MEKFVRDISEFQVENWLAPLSRIATMFVTTSSTILTAKIVFRNLGTFGYGLMNLYLSLSLLFPFATLGVGALAINLLSAANSISEEEIVEAKVAGLFSVFIKSSCLLITFSLIFLKFRIWNVFFGNFTSGQFVTNLTLSLALMFLSLTIPLSIAQSYLLAKNKIHYVVLIQGLSGPLSLTFVWIGCNLSFSTSFTVLAPCFSNLISSMLIWTVANIKFNKRLNLIAKKALNKSERDDSEIKNSLGPMSTIVISLALAFQSDKFILARFGTVSDVALYSLTAQLLSPTFSLMALWTSSFWPILVRKRSSNQGTISIIKKSLRFIMIVTIFLEVTTYFFSRIIIGYVSEDKVSFRIDIFFLYALVVLSQIIHTILSYALINSVDLKFQARNVFFMAILNILLSIFLTIKFGPAGPLIATLTTLIPIVIVPNYIRSIRTLN